MTQPEVLRAGVATRTGINGDRLTFGLFIDAAGERFGERPAIVCSDQSYATPQTIRRSYAELASDVRALHAGLVDAGVRPGEHVAVMLSSFYEWVLYLFAVTRIGAIFVPLNPRFGSHELAHVLRHSGSTTLVAMGRYLERDYAALIAEVAGAWSPGQAAANLPDLHRIVGVRTPPHPDALMTDALLERGRDAIAGACASRSAAGGVERAMRFAAPGEVERAMRPAGGDADGAAAWPAAATDIDATAILFYTSGTTAFPKGVPLTHRNLLPHSIGCGALIDLTPDDRVLTLYPFFGISGGANKVLSTIAFGSCLVFQDAFRADEAYALLMSENCAVIHAVDVQLRELVRLARTKGSPQSPPRRASVAFMAGLDVDLARDLGTVLGIDRFVHAYGMTETNPMVLRNHPADPFEARLRPGGRVAPHAEVRVVDASTGIEIKDDTPGEIEVRGQTVMKGYYRDAEATKAAFHDGWFRTGDQGARTAEGFIFYLGRLKDMLKIGGFNVAPQEVEAYLRTHDAVEDVAVTGLADARLGEVAVAFVKPRPGRVVDANAIREFCRGHIANYKMPQHVWMVDALPYHTAANGSKLRRDVLRKWAAERIVASVASTEHPGVSTS